MSTIYNRDSHVIHSYKKNYKKVSKTPPSAALHVGTILSPKITNSSFTNKRHTHRKTTNARQKASFKYEKTRQKSVRFERDIADLIAALGKRCAHLASWLGMLAQKPRLIGWIGLGFASVAALTLYLSSSLAMHNFPGLPELPRSREMLLEFSAPDWNPLREEQLEPVSEAAKALAQPLVLSTKIYQVKTGESLEQLSRRFGLRKDSIISLNRLQDEALQQGKQLKIPNMDGIVYLVRAGDSFNSIANSFKVDRTSLADANDLHTDRLQKGQNLFIPGARLPASFKNKTEVIKLAWPLRGIISSPYGLRSDPFTGVKRIHAALDISVDLDTPVKAPLDGIIVEQGYNNTLGNFIILNHGKGIQTLYAHLASFLLAKDTSVKQGEVFALSGNSGYSTGPHLHFALYKNGIVQNPLKFLK